MNWNRLALDEAPAAAVLEREAVKAWLKIEDASRNDDVDAAILAAMRMVDGSDGIGLALITQSWRLSLDCWPRCINVPLRPVQSVTSITYLDFAGVEQTLAADQYQYDLDRQPLEIRPAWGVCWPSHLNGTLGAIKVTVVAGYGDTGDAVPGDLVLALRQLVGHFLRNREGQNDLPSAAMTILGRYGHHLG